MLHGRDKMNEYTVLDQAAKYNLKLWHGRWRIKRGGQHFEAGFDEMGRRNGRWMKVGQNCIQWRTPVLTVTRFCSAKKQLMYLSIVI